MTIQDMHRRIEQETFHVDGLFPERIDEILNDTIEDFIRSKLPKKRNIYQEGLDDSTIAAKDLLTLKVFRQFLSPDNVTDPVSTGFNLPANCLFPLSFDTEIYYSITHKPSTLQHPRKITPGRIVDFEYMGEIMVNSIKQSTHKSPLGVLVNDRLRVVKDKSFIIKDLYLNYLKKPDKVRITLNPVHCNLPESTHTLIVNRAIAYILENSESERLQTKAALNQKNE
jgi:hypothetical protein